VVRIQEYAGKPEWVCKGQRLQVDYAADLLVVRAIYKALGPDDDFGIKEIVDFLNKNPKIRNFNKHCKETVLRR